MSLCLLQSCECRHGVGSKGFPSVLKAKKLGQVWLGNVRGAGTRLRAGVSSACRMEQQHLASLRGDGEMGLASRVLPKICSLDLPGKYFTASPGLMASKAIRCVQSLCSIFPGCPKGKWLWAGHTGGDTVNRTPEDGLTRWHQAKQHHGIHSSFLL